MKKGHDISFDFGWYSIQLDFVHLEHDGGDGGMGGGKGVT